MRLDHSLDTASPNPVPFALPVVSGEKTSLTRRSSLCPIRFAKDIMDTDNATKHNTLNENSVVLRVEYNAFVVSAGREYGSLPE